MTELAHPDAPMLHDRRLPLREAPLDAVFFAHARVASRRQVLADRRTLYRLATSLVGADRDGRQPDHVFDAPAVRFAVGEVLAGRRAAADLRLPTVTLPRQAGPEVAGDPAAVADLAPALDAVAEETGTLPDVIVEGDSRFGRAVEEVHAGLEQARVLIPDLFADLVGHVAVIGLLDPSRSGTVVSASSRSMPGVVLLRPGTPLEVAESIVHEAAHQRLFDMALTRDMLRADADGCAGCRPSWRRVTWPWEQTLAAFHAYACLAELRRALPATLPEMPSHSVLPAAAARARELGEWLFERSDRLGEDACRLVCSLLGRPRPLALKKSNLVTGRIYRPGRCTVVPTEEGRCLVGIAGPEPQLFWLDRDAATVLGILQVREELPAEAIRAEFARLRRVGDPVPVFDALDRLVSSDLAAEV